jgi:hypothetical protein
MMMMRAWLTCLLLASLPAIADEGMWTYNSFPSAQVGKSYGFPPSQHWLDKVRLGSARLAQGCSASFVSANGLVMTNHHCAHRCIEQLSKAGKDFVKDGFLAPSMKAEAMCPEMEVNQLVDISDVTARIRTATKGKTGAAFNDAQKAEESVIREQCATDKTVRCDIVTLYSGGVYNLYKYKRYQDVRLVFAPEFAIAFFGGDPDNFMFPRYDLDAAFLRVYENGKPVAMTSFLPFAKSAAKDGDLVFVSGHPGRTSRNETVAQLRFERDVSLPMRLLRTAELRGVLTEYANRGAEQKRHSNAALFYVENSYKARQGYWSALVEGSLLAGKEADEKKLASKAKDKKAVASALKNITQATTEMRRLYLPYLQLEAGWAFYGDVFPLARSLIRAAAEKALPNDKRLKGFTDADMPALEQSLFSEAPVYPEFEVTKLTFGLTKLREQLGADHPVVKKVLGSKSPATLAAELMKTKLVDVKERKRIYAGGQAAIDASQDPMIVLAKLIDADARAIRKEMEDKVDSVEEKEAEVLAKARFDAFGTSVYPDATFSLRLSYGAVKGWDDNGVAVPALTTMAGAFDRHTGEDPYRLPDSWMKAKGKLTLTTPMNVATTNDIIGGNSGSPLINKDAEVVGLIFDGNIHSLGGDYGYDGKLNRAVAVHSATIIEALQKIYGAKALADELQGKAVETK